ncbi:MAG: hypothetical protein PVI57_00585 [Gemmatimonadota bacterium]|jgi:hypothetical protein
MTLFEHLSVLISIVIGLGLTHILSNAHELVQARDRVRRHWLPMAWAVLVFVALVQWWWTSFTFRTRHDWTFFYFLFLLLRPVVFYLAAAFVLPRVEPDRPCDMRAYYFRTRGWLFSLLAFGQVLDGVRRIVAGEPITEISVWSNFVSATLVGSLARVENVRWHAVITVLTAALFLAFLVQSALTLT